MDQEEIQEIDELDEFDGLELIEESKTTQRLTRHELQEEAINKGFLMAC